MGSPKIALGYQNIIYLYIYSFSIYVFIYFLISLFLIHFNPSLPTLSLEIEEHFDKHQKPFPKDDVTFAGQEQKK